MGLSLLEKNKERYHKEILNIGDIKLVTLIG